MATHSSILAWRIPWMEEPGGATVHGVAESDTTERLHFHFQAGRSSLNRLKWGGLCDRVLKTAHNGH